MASYSIAANMEFVRSADKDFRAGVAIAAELGYTQVEPMVHTGWGLLSEVGYFHSFSMEEDPLLMKEICDAHGISVGSLSAHSPLMKPEAAVDRLTRAIVLADMIGARVVNTDEMLKPDWMDDEEAHQAMHYSLKRLSHVAARHKIFHRHRAPRHLHQDGRGSAAHRQSCSFALDWGQLGYSEIPISRGWKTPMKVYRGSGTMSVMSMPKTSALCTRKPNGVR